MREKCWLYKFDLREMKNKKILSSSPLAEEAGNKCIYIHMYIYTHTRIYICIYSHTHIYIFVQTYVHIYIYISNILPNTQLGVQIDCGSSVIVKHSFVRKLQNIWAFVNVWQLISDLDLEIWRQICEVLSNEISGHTNLNSNSCISLNFHTHKCFTISELPRSISLVLHGSQLCPLLSFSHSSHHLWDSGVANRPHPIFTNSTNSFPHPATPRVILF